MRLLRGTYCAVIEMPASIYVIFILLHTVQNSLQPWFTDTTEHISSYLETHMQSSVKNEEQAIFVSPYQ